MAKQMATFAVTLLIAGCAISPSVVQNVPAVKTDVQREELKGPVKTVVITFVEKDEKGEPDERALGSSTYDPAGNLVEDEQFTADFAKKRIPERKDATTTVYHSKMGDAVVHDILDGNGNVLEEQVRYGLRFDGPADTVTRFKYDSLGLSYERAFVGPDGKLSGVSTYHRDRPGNIVEEDSWLNDPLSPHAHMTYRYDFDGHGNWVRRYETRTGVADDDYQFGKTGTLVRTITYFGGPSNVDGAR